MADSTTRTTENSNSGGSQTTSPWAGTIPYLLNNMSEAQRLYNLGPQQYTPWSQVASQNPNQLAAIQGVRDYINSPGVQTLLGNQSGVTSGLLSGAGGYNPQQDIGQQGAGKLAGYVSDNSLGDTTDGVNRFMYQNTSDPALNQTIQDALDAVHRNMPAISGIQGIGNGIANNIYGLNETNAINSTFGHAYDAQQQQRLAAIGLGNDFQNNQAGVTAGLLNTGDQNQIGNQQLGLQYFNQALTQPLDLLALQGGMGDTQQQYNQNQLNDASNRWAFGQNSQLQNLINYSNLIMPVAQMGNSRSVITTGSNSQTNPNGNKLMGAAGGALSGAGMGATLGPYGALAGGVIGAGLGYFSK